MIEKNIYNVNMTLYKTKKGFNFLEMGEYEEAYTYKILNTLKYELGFQEVDYNIKNTDKIIINLVRKDKMVILGWNVWDGCYIMAEDISGDECILEIQKYFEKVSVKDAYGTVSVES